MSISDGERVPGSAILDVYEPICGWKARCMCLYRYDDGQGAYYLWEPESTGFCGYKTREEALEEMRSWAEAEGLPTIEDTNHAALAKELVPNAKIVGT